MDPTCPAPEEDDFSKGILETIDMGRYRLEKQAAMKTSLRDEDAEIGPIRWLAAVESVSPTPNS